MRKIIIESKIERKLIDTDDGGCYREIVLSEDENTDQGVFFRIGSWSDHKKHPEMDELVGKEVRLTFEIIEK